jgi:anaerobic sulfite reductase subunit C
VAVVPAGSLPAAEGKAVTIIANLRRENIDELISTLESLDAVGGRHLKVTVRDGFEIEGVPEHLAARLEGLLSELGVEHYTLERAPIHLTGCHHLFDCPRDLVGTESLTSQLSQLVDESGVQGVLLDSVKGNVDPRTRLKVAMAGCTSSCNAPQVQDFGIVAKAHPKVTETACEAGCHACVDICEDSAVKLAGDRPVVTASRCTDCGQCMRVCPTGTLAVEKSGFEIFEGGRLGREPKLGTRVQEWASFDEVRTRLKKALTDIAYCLEPAAPAPLEIKPEGVSLPGAHGPMATAAAAKLHVPEPARLHPRD